MDIYEFAIQMEQDGENLYRQLATQSGDMGIRRILTMLADDEVKHREVVAQMRVSAPSPMPQTEILARAQNIFAQLKTQDIDLGGTQVELYQQAQDIERKSKAFYLETASQVADHAQKRLLTQIADEEGRHFFLLDHVIEFLSRPLTWIEDAEFNHLTDY